MADGSPGLAAAGEDGLGGEQLDEWDEECLAEGLEGRQNNATKEGITGNVEVRT